MEKSRIMNYLIINNVSKLKIIVYAFFEMFNYRYKMFSEAQVKRL